MMYKYISLVFLFLSIVCDALAQAGLSDQYRARAEKLYDAGKYAEALQWYNKAYDTAMPDDKIRRANLCVDISSVYHLKGNYEKAKQICRQGMALIKESSPVPDSILYKLNSSLGEMYHNLYQYDSAHYYFQQSLSIYQNHPSVASQIPDYVVFGLNNQAMLNLAENNYKQAGLFLEKAIEVQKQGDDKEYLAVLMNNFGGYLDKTGSYEKAAIWRNQALELFKNNDPKKISILTGLAWDYHKTGKNKLAIICLQKALSIPAENPAAKTRIYYALTQCYLADHRQQEAATAVKTGMRLAELYGMEKGKLKAELYLGSALLYDTLRQYQRALKQIQMGLISAHTVFENPEISNNPSFEGSLSEIIIYQLLQQKARILRKLFARNQSIRNLENSLATYLDAIKFREKMLARLDRLETRILVTEQQFSIFEEALETAFLLFDKTKKTEYYSVVFSIMEYSRAGALSNALINMRLKPATLPDSLIAQEKVLQQKIVRLKSEVKGNSNEQLESKIRSNEFRLAALYHRYKTLYPIYYKALYEQKKITIGELQSFLDPDETYLDYFTGNSSIYMLAATKTGIKIIKQPFAIHGFENNVTDFCQRIYKNPGINVYNGADLSKNLYKLLITPNLPMLRKRLIVARSGILMRLPFEVLESGLYPRDYLGRSKMIRYTHSATVLFSNENKNTGNNEWLTFAPFAEESFGDKRAALPETSNSAYGDKVLTGPEASKYHFMKIYNNFSVLNLATHAVANDRASDETYISFYPENGDYHKLFITEILQLDLSSVQLVLLGACQGDVGPLFKGEGVHSLAYSFAYAGCPSVVSTVWKAHDATTAFLTSRFAVYCRQGQTLDEALFNARNDYFLSDDGRKYDHPFYWANLVLWGKANSLPAKNPQPWIFILIVSITLVAASGYLYKQRSSYLFKRDV